MNLLHKACGATVISDRVSLYKPRLHDVICVLFGVFRHLCGSVETLDMLPEATPKQVEMFHLPRAAVNTNKI